MKKMVQQPGNPPHSQLFPHAAGKWAKEIKGLMHYSGKWSVWSGALKSFKELAGVGDSVVNTNEAPIKFLEYRGTLVLKS